jgi:hypothetical protein
LLQAADEHVAIDADESTTAVRDLVDADAEEGVGDELLGERFVGRSTRTAKNEVVSVELFSPIEDRLTRDEDLHENEYRTNCPAAKIFPPRGRRFFFVIVTYRTNSVSWCRASRRRRHRRSRESTPKQR